MAAKTSLDADVLDLLDELDAVSAEYIVVGAHALAIHGIVRATNDFDLLVRATDENARRVHLALINFGAPLKAHGVEAKYFAQPERVYQMGLPPKRIDIITSISGVSSDEAFASAIQVRLGNHRRNVLSLETLLKNKQATGRSKDKVDEALLQKAITQRSAKAVRGRRRK